MLRDARPADLPALLALEAQFPGDQMRPRQFRHHLRNPGAALRVLAEGGEVLGYALLLMREGTAPARLYSLVVDRRARGRGLGARLLRDAERIARRRSREALRLEVRVDNPAAIALYQAAGYRRIGRREGYYEDGADALRFEKALREAGSRTSTAS